MRDILCNISIPGHIIIWIVIICEVRILNMASVDRLKFDTFSFDGGMNLHVQLATHIYCVRNFYSWTRSMVGGLPKPCKPRLGPKSMEVAAFVKLINLKPASLTMHRSILSCPMAPRHSNEHSQSSYKHAWNRSESIQSYKQEQQGDHKLVCLIG